LDGQLFCRSWPYHQATGHHLVNSNSKRFHHTGFGHWSSIVRRRSLRSSPALCSQLPDEVFGRTYLLVGSNNISTVADEFAHINAWARTNNLQLNPSKTRELVVSRRRFRTGSVANLFLQGATRVTSMRVLGVVITGNLTMECHIEELLSSCASSI